MIEIKKNENFQGWIQIFSFGQFIDEVQGRAKAMRIASKLARKENLSCVSHFGKIVKVDS